MSVSIPVLNAEQSARWDSIAREDFDIPSRVLMESAGRAAAHVIARQLRGVRRQGVLVVCGPGNNGGDGWVVARALAGVGIEVKALQVLQPKTNDCKANRVLALGDGVEEVDSIEEAGSVGVIVDAMLGTGASGPLRGKIEGYAATIASYGAPIAAIDGPTGLDLSTGEEFSTVHADLTVTFGGLRRGHLFSRSACGKIFVVDIGFPKVDEEWPLFMNDEWARALLPEFEAAMHKGERGRVLVIGGADGMSGAPIHAAKAAFAAGAGLVKLVGVGSTIAAAQAQHPDIMTLVSKLGGKPEPAVKELLHWADAVALGPGLGRGEGKRAFVEAILAEGAAPVIADADALQVGADAYQGLDRPVVLTPHPGEFRALFPDAEFEETSPYDAAAQSADKLGVTMLLKGVPTVVSEGGETLVVGRGNPALATGGSGDVLTGLIGALLARGLEPRMAATLGAHVLGCAAELASGEHTVRSTRPEDVLDEIPEYWRALESIPDHTPPVVLELDPPALA